METWLQYHIDIVFCLDCTGSMGPVIDLAKDNVLKITSDLVDAYKKKEKHVKELRVRIVAFRDLANDLNSLEVSKFFSIEPSNHRDDFKSFLNRLEPSGGGDEPESALEALAIAVSSEWTDKGDRQRHVVVVLTDASSHRLEDRVGNVPADYADSFPKSLDELTEIWDGGQAAKLKRSARRLIIFGPDAYPWNTISEAWGQTVYLPSQAGKGLEDVEYSTILDTVANSV